MSKTLLQIDGDKEAIYAIMADVGGDVTEADAEAALDEFLEENKNDLEETLERYRAVYRAKEASAAFRRAEAEVRLEAARRDEANMERMKARLQWFFEKHGIDRVDLPSGGRFSLAGNGGKAPLVFASDYSPEHAARDGMTDFVRVSHAWNTDAVRQELENGVALPFAAMGERGKHLRVR